MFIGIFKQWTGHFPSAVVYLDTHTYIHLSALYTWCTYAHHVLNRASLVTYGHFQPKIIQRQNLFGRKLFSRKTIFHG